MKLHRSRYFLMVFMITLLIGTLPSLIVGGVGYYTAYHSVVHNAKSSSEQILEQTKSEMDLSLNLSERMLINFIQTPQLDADMSLAYNPAFFRRFNNLTHLLHNVQSYDLGLQDSYIINLDHGWAISNAGIESIEPEIYMEKYDSFIHSPELTKWLLSATPVGAVNKPLLMIKKIPIHGQDPKGLLIAVFDTKQMFSHIADSDSSFSLILDENLQVLNAEASLPSELETLISSDTGLTDNNQTYTFTHDGKKYYAFAYQSSYNHWYYIKLVSIDAITQQAKQIARTTFAICLIMVIAITAAAYGVSRRMYKPIRSLRELLIEGSEPISSKQDEMAVIHNNIMAIINNQNQLTSQVSNQLGQLKDFFVFKLLSGKVSASSIPEQIKSYSFRTEQPEMFVFVIRIFTLSGTSYRDKDRDLMLFAINNIMQHLYRNQYLLTPVVVRDSQVTVIGSEALGSDESRRNFVYREAEKITEAVTQYLNLKISIGISRHFGSYLDTERAFEEAQQALKYQLKLNDNGIYYLSDVVTKGKATFMFPHFILDALLSAIHAGDAQQAEQLLHELLTSLFSVELTLEEYHMHLYRLLSNIVIILDDYGLSSSRISKSHALLFEYLVTINSYAVVEKWLMSDVISPIIKLIEEQHAEQQKSITNQVIEIIEKEYQLDLSFEEVARRINFHPTYIRKIFQKETGFTLSEYIQKYRVELAKKWLVETDMKVQAIADALGYSNAQNFIRLFRKLTNMTPGQYREEKQG